MRFQHLTKTQSASYELITKIQFVKQSGILIFHRGGEPSAPHLLPILHFAVGTTASTCIGNIYGTDDSCNIRAKLAEHAEGTNVNQQQIGDRNMKDRKGETFNTACSQSTESSFACTSSSQFSAVAAGPFQPVCCNALISITRFGSGQSESAKSNHTKV